MKPTMIDKGRPELGYASSVIRYQSGGIPNTMKASNPALRDKVGQVRSLEQHALRNLRLATSAGMRGEVEKQMRHAAIAVEARAKIVDLIQDINRTMAEPAKAEALIQPGPSRVKRKTRRYKRWGDK